MAIAGRVAIVPKGDWSANATYKRLDAVTYNNTLYFAKKEVPAGTATSNTEYWSKSIVGGAGAIATKEDAGIVKPTDGLSIAEDGTLKVNIDGATLTMDQVNNVIKLSDTLKDKINGAFPAANLINNLTTTEAGFGLDARQGKALDDKITEINGSLGTFDFIPDGSNLNYYTSGVYMIGNADKLENSPDVSWSILIAFGSNFIYSVQIVISVLDSKNSIYVRTKTETNKWCPWFKK
mgnify:CR=1 FL=1|jgi:hypothetical protein